MEALEHIAQDRPVSVPPRTFADYFSQEKRYSLKGRLMNTLLTVLDFSYILFMPGSLK